MPCDEPSNRQSVNTGLRLNTTYYIGSDARLMWQGLQTITDYKGKQDKLNDCYALFEASNNEASAVPDDCVITLSVADMS